MKPFTRAAGVAAIVIALVAASAFALIEPIRAAPAEEGSPGAAPMMDHPMPGHGQMPGMAQPHGQGTTGMHRMHTGQMAGATPTLPGQDAFAAIQEIVRMLEADPKTDWSKVNLAALRQHLIDMNEVTLKADALEKPVDGGLSIEITGSGRTLAAIERMIPAHARELSQLNGWSAKTEALPNGVLLTVTADGQKEVQHIRGLGFIGLLVSGAHHQRHHFAMAKGEFAH
ncbi:MAG TPA: hypothetical protein VN980_07255 [Alphaproteobacteria bacterium]|nr:hypothetical protein [Alphaproteobacteria bacterium]